MLWDATGTPTIPVYDHIIAEDLDLHTYGPIVNTEVLCPDQYFFIQQETVVGSGVFNDYTGTLLQHDPLTSTVSI